MRALKSKSETVYADVERELYACMETGNFDRARTVLEVYKKTCAEDNELTDMSSELRTKLVADYSVRL